MIMEYLGAIKWDDPAIVGAVAASITAGIFLTVTSLINRSKSSSPAVVVMPAEKDVGEELSKAVGPLRKEMKSIREQLAQLAPKQPVPDSGEPLKIKAVEFYNAGFDAYHQGEIGQALGHWLDAVALDPDHAATHLNLGVALDDKGELDAAIEHYDTALRIDPDYAKAHSNLGVALAAKGELDVAIEHHNAALRIDLDYDDAHFNLGCALAQKKDVAAAVAALAKAIELHPRNRDDAKSDTDFDAIRDDPAFRKLVYGE